MLISWVSTILSLSYSKRVVVSLCNRMQILLGTSSSDLVCVIISFKQIPFSEKHVLAADRG